MNNHALDSGNLSTLPNPYHHGENQQFGGMKAFTQFQHKLFIISITLVIKTSWYIITTHPKALIIINMMIVMVIMMTTILFQVLDIFQA